MLSEQPGAHTPWRAVNQLLARDERFEIKNSLGNAFLFAPKTISCLAALVYLLKQEGLSFRNISNRISDASFSSFIPFISTHALVSCKWNESVVTVEAGCDLKTFHSILFQHGEEVALENTMDAHGQRTISSLIIEGLQGGGVLRQHSAHYRLQYIELLKFDGSFCRLGSMLAGATKGPLLQHLIWGIQTLPAIITRVSFKTEKIPEHRLQLAWAFKEKIELLSCLEKLQAFTCSWERLDCVYSGRSEEKSFILAQISGLYEEMEEFKKICPFYSLAMFDNPIPGLKNYFFKQKLKHLLVNFDQGIKYLTSVNYLWHHTLTDECWLIGPETIAVENPAVDFTWKEKFYRSLAVGS